MYLLQPAEVCEEMENFPLRRYLEQTTNDNSLLFIRQLCALHQQAAFLVPPLTKSMHKARRNPPYRNHNSWPSEERPGRKRGGDRLSPRGVHPFTFPIRRRSARRNRSLWNTKRSDTADTASTVTPCSFHSMLAAAHHRLASIQPQQRPPPPPHRPSWARDPQCLA